MALSRGGRAHLTGAPRVGITAARRAGEQAALVEAMGGQAVLGPALRADAPRPDQALAPALEAALAGPLDEAIFLTGVGAELTVSLAARLGRERRLRAVLAGARVIARGPKPRRALRALGVRIDWVVDPPRAGVIRDALLAGSVSPNPGSASGPPENGSCCASLRELPLGGRRILVQGFGPEPDEIAEPLRRAGAEVAVLCPYAGAWPDDPAPAQALARAAAAGEIDALTFTSAQAAAQFVALAERAGIDAGRLAAAGALVASVGPVTSAALQRAGLPPDLESDPPRMGALYRALADVLGRRSRWPRANAGPAISSGASEGGCAARAESADRSFGSRGGDAARWIEG